MITERIDHTLLRADATEEDIRGLCEEAVTYGFHSVCVNSSCVALCASLLKNTGIKVCTVIGFPLGAMSTTAKIAEATAAVKDGAEELDMVDIDLLKKAVLERPAGCECVLTAHTPPQWMLVAADYSTEMKCHRHPYQKGIKARKGIEY